MSSSNSNIEFSLFKDCSGDVCDEAFEILISNMRLIKENISEFVSFGDTEQINVVLGDTETIRDMNSDFRDKDESTDVLAFNIDSSLGEVWLCPKFIKTSADKSDTDFSEEVLRVTIHGLLHVLGYDHEKYFDGQKQNEDQEEMYKIQEEVLKSII